MGEHRKKFPLIPICSVGLILQKLRVDGRKYEVLIRVAQVGHFSRKRRSGLCCRAQCSILGTEIVNTDMQLFNQIRRSWRAFVKCGVQGRADGAIAFFMC
ncbi:hypothetical protein SBC2_77350 (plasmid) [Caballeronia sp. SBC2]|nr:hypothetical protein SBC2_77350 [Caballeronia sp. SBC2]